MSNKHNLVLYIDQELVENSRELGFNLSKTFENHLKHLLTQFSQVNSSNNSKNNGNSGNWWAGPDSNRRPSVLSLCSGTLLRSARPADVLTISRQLTGALFVPNKHCLKKTHTSILHHWFFCSSNWLILNTLSRDILDSPNFC